MGTVAVCGTMTEQVDDGRVRDDDRIGEGWQSRGR